MAVNEGAIFPSIQVVVVLYECALAASQSFASFVTISESHAELVRHFSLMVYDNSPAAQACPTHAGLAVEYVHDASNGGLARAYNFALAQAETRGAEWLLLLDQDTSLTVEFLSELVATSRALATQPEIAAIAPKLLVHGQVYSPAVAFIHQLRNQFRRRALALDKAVVGVPQTKLYPYNSASTLRVSALRSVGGFPEEFWLDFLDHAIYHALFHKGYTLYVLLAGLTHESSYSDLGSLSLWRFQNVLRAQALYLKQNGTFVDQMFFRVYLLRHSRTVRRCCKDSRMWKAALAQAFLLKTHSEPRRAT